MKTSEIKVGTRCWTNVSQGRVEVEVVQDRGGRGRRYLLKRVDTGQTLNALRAATALHASGAGAWQGAFGPAEPPVARHGYVMKECPKHGEQAHMSVLGGACEQCHKERLGERVPLLPPTKDDDSGGYRQ